MFNDFILYAEPTAPVAKTVATAAASNASGNPGVLFWVVYVIGLLAAIYFLTIRPQKKKAEFHRKMIAELKEGDTVITATGIKGEIISKNDEFFEVRVDKGVKLTIKKSFIGSKYDK